MKISQKTREYLSHLRIKILNTLFPQKISVEELERMAIEGRLADLPRNNEDLGGNNIALFSYRDARVRDLVWEIKYKKNPILVEAVAKLLFEEIFEDISDAQLFRNKESLLIPIPVSDERRRERGYNQMEVLGKAIEKLDTEKIFSYNPKILKKSHNTVSQTKTKSKKERLENIKGSFAITNPSLVLGRDIILLDDVLTTGATFAEASRILKQSGAKHITCLAIAH
jgi:ComF family protein